MASLFHQLLALDVSSGAAAMQWASVVLMTLTGVYEARRRNLDLLGALVIAFVSAMGGGTVRDILLGRYPIFWVRDPVPLLSVAGVATAGVLALAVAESPARHPARGLVKSALQPVSAALAKSPPAVVALDALGLGLFSYVGSYYALESHACAVAAVVMGMITASFGGFLRDLFFAEIPRVLRRTQLYAVCAVAGSGAYVLLRALEAPQRVAAVVCVVLALGLRMLSVRMDLRLPV